jgi:hypothetical protein
VQSSKSGWSTLHEALDETGLSARRFMELVEHGHIGSKHVGRSVVYDPVDIARIAHDIGVAGDVA